MGDCKLCNVRHPSFYCRKQDLLDKQARKLQKLIKERIIVLQDIWHIRDSYADCWECREYSNLQSLIEESEK